MSDTCIKTTISTNDTFDEEGKFLPAGSYYFEIQLYRNGMFAGELSNRGSYGRFVFRPTQLVQMMSVGQARLARRCQLAEPGMPTYTSPVQQRRRQVRPPSPTVCSICLDAVVNHAKTLRCNHVFHESCINRWFQNSSRCPLCRRSETRRLPQLSRLHEPVFRPTPRPPPLHPRRRSYLRRRSNIILS